MADRESKQPDGGKALYFSKVEGSPFPVAINLFGSPKRICMALGVDNLDQLGARIRDMMEMPPPRRLADFKKLLAAGMSALRSLPRRKKNPPCQEVVHTGDAVDLTRLPVLQCWPGDAGPFITLPLVFTRSLETGKRNLGMYRLQVFDKKTTGMHWHIHKDGSHYYQEYRRAGQIMPVAVAIGADPATIYVATAPMPRNLDEIILAGFIRHKPVSMARCLTVDLEVPAEAEFVLEGFVKPDELRREGPFGDHTGFYSLADDYPVFHVTALTHRRSPVYCATLVGPPPMEDGYLGQATERLFLPMIQAVLPEIKDYWLPWEGAFHNLVVVSIQKEYPGQAQKVMHHLWGQGQMSFCKTIVVVDAEVDLTRPDGIADLFFNRFDPESDITLAHGILDVLDHSSPTPCLGSKIGIDLTARCQGETERTKTIPLQTGPADGVQIYSLLKEKIHGLQKIAVWPKNGSDFRKNNLLLVTLEKDRPGRELAQEILQIDELADFNMVLLFDPQVDIENPPSWLWRLLANVDSQRDMVRQGRRLVVDACRKGPMDGYMREWPEELVF